jgi:hypothetical protein
MCTYLLSYFWMYVCLFTELFFTCPFDELFLPRFLTFNLLIIGRFSLLNLNIGETCFKPIMHTEERKKEM